MFVNVSNHPSVNWSEAQRQAACQWGQIIDYPFPDVAADTNEEEIRVMADRVVCDVVKMEPDAVMCQGEFTLTFSVVSQLKDRRIPVVAACSERVVNEVILEDGNYKKVAGFQFVRFRKY